MKRVFKSLAKSVLILLELTAASAKVAANQKKRFGSRMITLLMKFWREGIFAVEVVPRCF